MSFGTRFAAFTAAAAFTLIIVACGDHPSEPKDPDPDYITVRAQAQQAAVARELAQIKAATAPFHNIANARAAGYVDDGFGCIEDPVLGGMGWHLIRDDLHADPAIDPTKPELLVYMPQKNGQMKLVAVEYEVFQADWIASGQGDLPSIAGHTMIPLIYPGLDPVYELHVWVWEKNPAGMFEDFNPAIACP